MNKSSDDIIKKLINDAGINARISEKLSEDDIKNKLRSVDRNQAMNKLRAMGLGNVADRLKNVSDEELMKMVSQNPALLKKINSFLK